MLSVLKDIVQLVGISGFRGFKELLTHSRHVKKYGGNFALMHCLMALEKSQLTRQLLSPAGLDVRAQVGMDSAALSAVCEYLYESDVLARAADTVYRPKNRSRYRSLQQAAYACLAYLEPIHALDKLVSGRYVYGRDVARSDKYDAIASATLTSKFSYGFAQRILNKVRAQGLLDIGCGTGGFLVFLEENGFDGRLYGIDAAADAVQEGKTRGFESEKVKLLVGDVLDLPAGLAGIDARCIDVVSFMFVLHEFRDDQVEAILRSIRRALPRARILLTELIHRSSDEMKKVSRTVFPELKLVHAISKQVLRTPAKWKRLLSDNGFAVTAERSNRLTGQVGLLFDPRSAS